MVVPNQRRRAFAPKTRHGCDKCKQRRVKCDETRPVCDKCQKRGLECAYTEVKVWIFEPKKPLTRDAHSSSNPSASPDLFGLTSFAWPAEERQSMFYYMRRTGPWLSLYCHIGARRAWAVTIPRMAMHLPALRHLVVAIAMMDERLHLPDSQAIVRRSERIIFHYNEAIQLLTKNAAPLVEVLASAIIAHILETMMGDAATARVHLQAAERLLARGMQTIKPNNGSEAGHDLLDDLRLMYIGAAAYHSTEPAFRLEERTPAVSILEDILALHSHQRLKSTREVCFVFEVLFEHINNTESALLPSVAQAREFTSMWELAILQLSHDSREPHINMIAAHMLVCVANALVPQICHAGLDEDDLTVQSSANARATGYIIRRLFNLMQEDTKDLGQADLATCNAMLKLAFRTISRFARNESHRNEARILLEKLEISGQAADRGMPSDPALGRAVSFAEPAAKLSPADIIPQPFVLSAFASYKLGLILPPGQQVDVDLPYRAMK